MNVNGHGKGQVRGFVINWLMELSSLEEDMGPYDLRGSWFCC